MEFKCPHCNNWDIERVHSDDKKNRLDNRTIAQRIQNSDDLNIKNRPSWGLVELWQCTDCWKYFHAYYKLYKITKLEEIHEK